MAYKKHSRQDDLAIAQLMAEGKTLKEIAVLRESTVSIVQSRIESLRRHEKALSTVHLIAKLILKFDIAPRTC